MSVREGLVLFEGNYLKVVPRTDFDSLAAELAACREQLAFANDAAAKGDLARQTAGGMEMEIQELRARLGEANDATVRAEGVLRVIASTDYRGNRSTEAMAAQAYFDAARGGGK